MLSHQTGMTKNLRAARVSMPTQLKPLTEGVKETMTSSSEFREEDEDNSNGVSIVFRKPFQQTLACREGTNERGEVYVAHRSLCDRTVLDQLV